MNYFKENEDKLCELMKLVGYGRTMQLAQQEWRDGSGGEFAYGPCVCFTTPCGCGDEPSRCDWCCGSRWLTKKVKEEKTKLEGKPKKVHK